MCGAWLDSLPPDWRAGGAVTASADQTRRRLPSTNSSMPVTKLESSEARNTAALATSSGSPMRPIGMVARILAMASGGCRSTMGVLIGPGLNPSSRIGGFLSSPLIINQWLRSKGLYYRGWVGLSQPGGFFAAGAGVGGASGGRFKDWVHALGGWFVGGGSQPPLGSGDADRTS